MAPKARLCTLSVLEFYNFYPLKRLFPNSEKPCGNLCNNVIIVGFELIRIPSFSGTAESSQGGGGLHAAEHGVNAHRPVTHPTTVKRHLNAHPVGVIATTVQHDPHIDVAVFDGKRWTEADPAALPPPTPMETQNFHAFIRSVFGQKSE